MGSSLRRLVGGLALAVGLLMVVAPAGAVVRYSYVSDPVGPHGIFSGFIEFDEALQLPNATIAIADFTNWAFAWGGAFTYDPSTHAFDPALSSFMLGPSLEVANSTSLCVGPIPGCLPLPPDHPFFGITGSVLDISSGPGSEDIVTANGTWSFTVISEPGTLALFAFGLGLIVLGQAGRRWREKRSGSRQRDDKTASSHSAPLQGPLLQR